MQGNGKSSREFFQVSFVHQKLHTDCVGSEVLEALAMTTTIFKDMTPCSSSEAGAYFLAELILWSEDEDSMYLQKTGKLLPDHTALHSRG